MTTGAVVWQAWLARHAWVMWPLVAATAFCFFMSFRESERFRRYFWRVTSKVVPLPLPEKENETSAAVIASPRQILRDKVLQMGRGLFAFLREKGPRPEARVDKSMTDEEILAAGDDEISAYIDGVHYGYRGRFKQSVVDLFNELAENGIDAPDLQSWEINPPQIQNADAIRKIAEHLFLIAARMDIAEASKGT
jgi:hypothetical protein